MDGKLLKIGIFKISQDRDTQDLQRTCPAALNRRTDPLADGVHGHQRCAKLRGGGRGSLDGFADVEQFKSQEDQFALLDRPTDNPGTGGREELQSDFDEGDFLADTVNETLRVIGRGQIQRQDQSLPGINIHAAAFLTSKESLWYESGRSH